MTTDVWAAGISADWNTAADWSGGVPSASTTATIGGAGSFIVTLFGSGMVGGLNVSAPGGEFYVAGTLSLGGTLALQAGTLALAGGAIDGGTLAMNGGVFQSNGGTLAGVAVQGALSLTTPEASLVVSGGLSLSGAGGSNAGSIALTGSYATLDMAGSQTLNNATISLGAAGALPGQGGAATLAVVAGAGATSGATLTLGSSLWLRGGPGEGLLAVGNAGPLGTGGLPEALINRGTITASATGEVMAITGNGSFTNQGTIGVSNGATLQIGTAGFSNSGTITVSNATLSFGGAYAASLLSSLGAITVSAGQIQIAGVATNAGTLAIGAGSHLQSLLGSFSLAGTIAGGTIADGGGGLSFAPGTGVLDGVRYLGTLNLGTQGSVTLTDGTQVTGAITDAGAGDELLLRGPEILDNVQIALGGTGGAAVIGTTDTWLASTATTATLGAHATVVQVGQDAGLEALGWSGVAGVGLADTLVNQGVITASVSGGLFALGGYGTIINQGSIAVGNGDLLSVTVQQFANAGTLTASSGGTIELGQPASGFGPAPGWSNAGTIDVAGGTLLLGGAFSASQLGTIVETGGAVVMAGTLANTGSTLTLGTGHLTGLTLTGTIAGGTVADAAGLLSVGGAGGALLDGVAYQGTLALGGGAYLRIRDGLTLAGTADIIGAGSILDFLGAQTLAAGHVVLGSGGGGAAIALTHDFSVAGNDILTLGAGVSITQSGQLATIGQAGGVAGDGIVNRGTITAAVAGGTLSLAGPGFTNAGSILVGAGETLSIGSGNFANTGTIAVNGGDLAIAGSLTLAGLGRVGLSGGGALSIAGTLELSGGTLAIGAGAADGRLVLTGTIADGTLVDGGGGLSPASGACLYDVTYEGLLDLSRPFVALSVGGGFSVTGPTGTGPGRIVLTGAQTSLVASTTETIDNAQITLGSASQFYQGQKLAAPELAAAAGVQLTLGRGTTLSLNGSGAMLGDSGLGRWSDRIVNAGQIFAETFGALTLGASFFTNSGTITAATGGVVTAGDVGLTNTGLIVVGHNGALQLALLEYYASPDAAAASFTNAGTISLQGGILQELTGNGLFPGVPLANLSAGTIVGAGLIFAPIANAGTIEAHGGQLTIVLPVTGAGQFEIDPGATLELSPTIAASQIVNFTSAGGTLKLDSPTTFGGVLSNLAAGDVIDLPSVILTGVGLSSGTLVASTATQNFRFSGASPIGGEVSAGHDAHGGAAISVTPQSASGGTLTIAVGQPAMLFWASPAGDDFQGPIADTNGAHISNWGVADSLDITDLSPAHATLTVSQTTGLTTVTVTDGTHSASVGLSGTFTASSFHVASDGHGGTLLTYGH